MDEQSATGLPAADHAGKHPGAAGLVDGSGSRYFSGEQNTPPRDGGDYEIAPDEAHELYEQVRDRQPDAVGTGSQVHIVETSAGPAVFRRGLDHPRVVQHTLKKWMPENTAITYARESGVRTPRILHAGTDPTGREFTIMQYVPGVTRRFDDPEVATWLPDLLEQVRLISSHPLPAGMNFDIPQWQQQMIRHADGAYRNLPPEQRSKLDRLGIGPLSDYVQPDLSRSGEPTVFAHNDLYPPNLRLDDQGKLWILDWEIAGPGDPLFNIGSFVHRMGPKTDEETRAQAADIWLDQVPLANAQADTGAALRMYRTMEDWRGIVMTAGTLPRLLSEQPHRLAEWVGFYDKRFSRNVAPWPVIPKDELFTILREWAE